MQTQLKVKLSLFMFIQYFIWSAWYMSLGTYLTTTLKFTGVQVGAAYGAFAIGSMISPFFVGLIADRYFSSEKMLAALGILGGVVLCLLPAITSFGSFYPMLIAYCALYTPTLALGNSLSLHHLQDAKNDFPRVKIFSAVGWIAGGGVLSLLKGEQSPIQYYLAGGASVLLGIMSLMLPHTPPKKTGKNVSLGDLLGLDALVLLRKPSFAIFIVCMFLICIPLYFYFALMGIYLTDLHWTYPVLKMTLAQVSDVIFLFLLPIMLRRLGYKKTIFIGIFAWALRYFFLGASANMMELQTVLIFAAIVVHGVCYDFLFIAGQLYVDDESNERIRGACQGLIAFILWGIGAFVGASLAGMVLSHYTVTTNDIAVHQWSKIWTVPALGAVAVMLVFLIFFREPEKKAAHTVAESASEPTTLP